MSINSQAQIMANAGGPDQTHESQNEPTVRQPNSTIREKGSNGTRKAKIWRCGDPYKYPFPETEGNPWTTVLEPYMKNDRIQCEAWKDEVQNLLIFVSISLLFTDVMHLILSNLKGWLILCSRNCILNRVLQDASARSK